MKVANVTSASIIVALSVAGAALGADFAWTIALAAVLYALTLLALGD